MKYYNKRELKDKIDTRNKFKKIFKFILSPILIIIVLFNLYIVFQKITHPNQVVTIFGYRTYIVSSGSMEPFLEVGDIILVDKVENAESINVDDIITFSNGEGKDITHRVIEIKDVNNNKFFVTKGDNNNDKDANEVRFENIRGKYSNKIDGIGKFILNVKTSFGAISFVIVIFAIYFWMGKREDKEIERHLKRTEAELGIHLKKYGLDSDGETEEKNYTNTDNDDIEEDSEDYEEIDDEDEEDDDE